MTSGQIVNIASIAGRVPTPGSAVYSATKAAVLSFSEALDAELAPRIRVGCVLPTFTRTPLIDGTGDYPRLRVISAEQVADAVVGVLRRHRATTAVPRTLGITAAWPTIPALIPMVVVAWGMLLMLTAIALRMAYHARRMRG